MTENQVIVKMIFEQLVTVANEPFLLAGFMIVFALACSPAAARPIISYPHAEIRMQARKQPLAELTAKYFFQDFVKSVARAEAIAVVQVKLFAAALNFELIGNDGGVQLFFKVIEHPHIMVPFKKIKLYACVRQLGQFSEETDIALWHYGFVLEPKIKYIAH